MPKKQTLKDSSKPFHWRDKDLEELYKKIHKYSLRSQAYKSLLQFYIQQYSKALSQNTQKF